MYFVYVLRCEDGSLYCGSTDDVGKRLKAHLGKRSGGARYTASHPPVFVERVWRTDGKSDALKLEYRFKKLKKDRKEKLMEDGSAFADLFPDLSSDLFPEAAELVGPVESQVN